MPDISAFPRLPAIHGHSLHTDVSSAMYLSSPYHTTGVRHESGIKMEAGVYDSAYYGFNIWDDFVSLVGIYVYYYPAATGQIVLTVNAGYQKHGEALNTHSDIDNINIITITDTNMWTFVPVGLLASAEPGDFGDIEVSRAGDHVSDTLINDIYLHGVVIDYISNM